MIRFPQLSRKGKLYLELILGSMDISPRSSYNCKCGRNLGSTGGIKGISPTSPRPILLSSSSGTISASSAIGFLYSL